ncbi:MAG: addiction module protein [Planctomycetes bacterium]|nr:addiction module protein [Planctomycetota bacterium]
MQMALRLPAAKRAGLAARLIESLDEEVDTDVDAAWEREIARRIRDYEAGRTVPIPWSQAREMLLANKDESSDA